MGWPSPWETDRPGPHGAGGHRQQERKGGQQWEQRQRERRAVQSKALEEEQLAPATAPPVASHRAEPEAPERRWVGCRG